MSSSDFQKTGLRWVKHPAGFDLAAIPFILPPSCVKELDVLKITEDFWTLAPQIKVGNEIAHLGYPEKGLSSFSSIQH